MLADYEGLVTSLLKFRGGSSPWLWMIALRVPGIQGVEKRFCVLGNELLRKVEIIRIFKAVLYPF